MAPWERNHSRHGRHATWRLLPTGWRARVGQRLQIALVIVLAGAAPLAAGPESLPPDHWAYEELEHFESRGLLVLDNTRPYSRLQVQQWVESLREAGTESFTSTEIARLVRLEDEFGRGDSTLAARFDPPLASLEDTGWRASGDLALTSGAQVTDGGTDPATSWGTAGFEVTVGHKSGFVYDTRYRTSVAEESGNRTGENRISRRERSWHGLTSDNDRAYLAFERGRLRLSLGRDYIAWGARRGGELLVTETASSFDAVQARLRLGRFLLSSANALLASGSDRNYAAHRLEIAAGRARIGLQEAVIYNSPHFEPTYLFPVAFYYGNQFNERGDDNVLLGADAKWASRWGVLEGELLVDDFIYDGDPAPQKLAWRVGGGRGLALGGTDLDVRLGYMRIDRWTYTHRRPDVAYVGGEGDLLAGDPLLGNSLGPDADRWGLELQWRPRLSTRLWLLGARTRRGEGNADMTAWQVGEPYALPFPSGRVATSWRAEAGGRLQLGRTLEFGAAGAAERRAGGWDTSLRAEVRLDP